MQATIALDEELRRVGVLCDAASRIPLSSRRNLERAARSTADAAEAQTRVGERIRTLMDALAGAQKSNEATVASMQSTSDEIQRRSGELSALLERFDAVGQEAHEINRLMQGVTSDSAREQLTALETRMGAIAETARALWKDAGDGGWEELARDADALRQQVLSASNKVKLLARKLLGDAPN